MQPIRNQSSSSYGYRAVDPGDVKPQNSKGDTSLHLLVKYRDLEGLKARISNSGRQGSDLREMVNYQNYQGETPLHHAVQLDNKESICEELLNQGASPTIEDNKGNRPYHLTSHRAVMELLSKHGCYYSQQKLIEVDNAAERAARDQQERDAAHKAHYQSWQYYGN